MDPGLPVPGGYCRVSSQGQLSERTQFLAGHNRGLATTSGAMSVCRFLVSSSLDAVPGEPAVC